MEDLDVKELATVEMESMMRSSKKGEWKDDRRSFIVLPAVEWVCCGDVSEI